MEKKETERPDQPLEKMLKQQDKKLKNFDHLETSHGRGKPRMSFNNGLPRSQQSMSRLKLSNVPRLLSVMLGLFRGMFKSGSFYKKPMTPTSSTASPSFFGDLERLAYALGAKDIKYVSDIPDSDIFNGLGIPHRNAIVFTVEMDKEEIEKAPHFDTYIEVAKGYRSLGSISNRLTTFIRKHGFAAYPGTSLGGLTDYVSLAEKAGLGAIGYHGLLISPGMGPRLRINTIYTNIENLPRAENEHRWVRDFCAQCKNCVRSCPANAIYDQPRPRATGGMTSIKYEACLNYFSRDWGCAVCIKVCPFSEAGYDKIKEEFLSAARFPAIVPTSAPERASLPPLTVAVVGGGAAGFYLTEALLQYSDHVRVDIFEKLPVPFGLVRYGVAPDHQNIKTKAYTFEKILEDDRVNFYGNVAFGEDIRREELIARYRAVVYATGASRGRLLNIPGESLPAVVSAPDLVYWYNAHPDYTQFRPPLDHAHIAIIGTGNVSLDVARMLATPPDVLAQTDMAPYAVEALKASAVTDIHIIGRGGAAQTTFTPKELVEISELPGVQMVTHLEDFRHETPEPSEDPLAYARSARNLEIFASYARQPDLKASYRVHFHFYRSPRQVLGDEHRVTGLRVERTVTHRQVEGLRYEGTGEHQVLAVGAVVKSIGYQSVRLPGVRYDENRGVIPNREGRVTDAQGKPTEKEYTSGWVRRGARGIIGENKKDARQVADKIWGDYQKYPRSEPVAEDTARWLADRNVVAVDKNGLRRILQLEKQNGSSQFRTALKFEKVADMLAAARYNPDA